MQDSEAICPYPGLRPFTEEESLYFKGREDQITKLAGLLEEKKFLMVTGASGDGKSSLIYGGLIPHARAGFFKSSYSRWLVAGFRPERSPMKNMTEALAERLGSDIATTAIELSRGFSSLIDLYKASPLFIDKESKSWQEAGEEERDAMERNAGNLLIIIDQFEEFFTNPENFIQGVPSQDSRLLLNIILETAKISLRDNLPVYVVCTMRSDYIGQCAAFRGLPEFIGFSQFFVPRLQRRELQQVIEEPAILSGNRISKRLTDRLIFDLEEGVDQLPMLQHALKQIWKAADSGREQMDLIHYAMVGGMNGEKLPVEEHERFNNWKIKLPPYERAYLLKAGLTNVLDIHANKLYEEATASYNRKAATAITVKEAKLIIALSFSCLTRIDENRAVRNRMTLEEITSIINNPKFPAGVVSGVLSIFREPENTLVRPFIDNTGNPDAEPPGPETVLDITHEALIRNWQLLKQWSAKEFEYYSVFLDLKQQLNRWIDNGKSGDFLLPIGPLTYFEKWYKDCRPNKFWINRYNESDSAPSGKLKESEEILDNIRKFLRKSALNLLITRIFMKYGAAKIARTTGLTIMLALAIFLTYNWHLRRNDVVIKKLVDEGASILNDKATAGEVKAWFALFASRLDSGSLSAISQRITDNQTRIDIALKIFERIYFVNKASSPHIKLQALSYADSLIRQSDTLSIPEDASALNSTLNNLNDIVRDEAYYLRTKTDNKIYGHFNSNKKLLGNIIVRVFTAPAINRNIDIKAVNTGIENTLNFWCLSKEQITALAYSISPFENNPSATQKFETLFPFYSKLHVGLERNNFFSQTVSHNGGYEKLACLYAALGNVPKVLRCLDSLNKYNETYDQNWNNSANISGYFLMYRHVNEFRDFVRDYSKVLGIPRHVFIRGIANRAGIENVLRTVKFIGHGNYNENLSFFDYGLVKELFGTYKTALEEEIKDRNELNFNLALLYKQQGVVYNKISKDSGDSIDRNYSDSLFSLAIGYYSKLPAEFLKAGTEIYFEPSILIKVNRIMKRSHIFLYPDHFKIGASFTAAGGFVYYGDHFFSYMLRHDLFRKYYHDKNDYQLLTDWIKRYFELYGTASGTNLWNRVAMNYSPLSKATLNSVDSILVSSGFAEATDDAWINMKLALDYFESGDTSNAFDHVRRIKLRGFSRPYYVEAGPFQNMLLTVSQQLAIHGKRHEAMNIVGQFSNIKNKTLAYSKLSAFSKMNGNDRESEIYQDSAMADLRRVKAFRFNTGNVGYDYRTGLVEMLTLQGNASSNDRARELISNMDSGGKIYGVLARLRALTGMDNYFQARSAIPELVNHEDRLRCITAILYGAALKRPDSNSGSWDQFDGDLLSWINYTDFLYDFFEY